jgi:hypothetical protein
MYSMAGFSGHQGIGSTNFIFCIFKLKIYLLGNVIALGHFDA